MRMQIHLMPSYPPLQNKTQISTSVISSSSRIIHHHSNNTVCFNHCRSGISNTNGNSSNYAYAYPAAFGHHHPPQFKNPLLLARKTSKQQKALKQEDPSNDNAETGHKGTIAGAVALIIGTSIGSGILALPKKISPAGFVPSSISMIICWGFLLVEALLLAEINVSLLGRKKRVNKFDRVEVISIRTMAQETLGEWGAALVTVTYVFLGYSSMVAYCSKSGDILFDLINLPASICGCFFTVIFATLIAVGGTRTTDHVNQWLTTCMIGLLLAIEVLAVVFGGWAGPDQGNGDWGEVPPTIPVMIFTLVYHDLAPVLCAYLGGDIARIRTSIIIGSVVPLLAILVWDGIALSLVGSVEADQASDPVELLMRVRCSGVSYMVEAFSLLAVGTSIIGTLLGFSEFFKEQLVNCPSLYSITAEVKQECEFSGYRKWASKRISFMAVGLVVAPSLLVSTTVPDAFSAATDVAGGYCMTMLYGILPPAMALAMNNARGEHTDEQAPTTKASPALFALGLLACGIVAEQILQDFSGLHH
ncbi:hypothetical protein Ancab_023517 [Ancistrocladus abbreviatus]